MADVILGAIKGEVMRSIMRSDAMYELCAAKAREVMPQVEANVNRNAHSPFREPCGCGARRLKNTCVGVVYTKTRGSTDVAHHHNIKKIR